MKRPANPDRRAAISATLESLAPAEGAFVLAFARWFNANVWGEVEGRAGSGEEAEGGEV